MFSVPSSVLWGGMLSYMTLNISYVLMFAACLNVYITRDQEFKKESQFLTFIWWSFERWPHSSTWISYYIYTILYISSELQFFTNASLDHTHPAAGLRTTSPLAINVLSAVVVLEWVERESQVSACGGTEEYEALFQGTWRANHGTLIVWAMEKNNEASILLTSVTPLSLRLALLSHANISGRILSLFFFLKTWWIHQACGACSAPILVTAARRCGATPLRT